MFCINCGAKVAPNAQFCNNCGAQVSKSAMDQPIAASTPAGAGDSFIGRLHYYGSGSTFFLGFILYAAGSVISIFINFSWSDFFSALLLILPIIGIYMVYNASTKPKSPEGTLTALTLFKISAIIGLVLFSLAIAVLFIALLMLLSVGSLFGGSGAGFTFAIFMVFGIIIALCVLYIKFYYLALLKALQSIKDGIAGNFTPEIKGVGSFTIISIIEIGLGVLGNIISLATSSAVNSIINEAIWSIPREFRGIAESFLSFGRINFFGVLISLASSLGLLMLILTLRQFAESVRTNPVN